MRGINLDEPIEYCYASLRYFRQKECHVSRICPEDVLVLVFAGILRFSENGIDYEVHPGEYFIQQKGGIQEGNVGSDAPKYLFVHFNSTWIESDAALPFRGNFDYNKQKKLMNDLDYLYYHNAPYIGQAGVFYMLLSQLKSASRFSNAIEISNYMERHLNQRISLETLCVEFHFSKNHIINLIKKEFRMTPIEYIHHLQIERAKYLLATTSRSLSDVAYESGFMQYSYFFRIFKVNTGYSPSDYRKKVRILIP